MQNRHARTNSSTIPRYALRKGLGCWELTFEGQRAIFKDEKGAGYVAYLLLNPPREPMHAVALALAATPRRRCQDAAADFLDPATGNLIPIGIDATIEERAPGLDDLEAARALRRKQLELEAELERWDVIEPVKSEIREELEAIYEFQARNACRTRSAAQKAADTVGKAVRRFYQHLASAVDLAGKPDQVLRAFAAHLMWYLLAPSGRGLGPGGLRLPEIRGGCFRYRPPLGVVWRATL